MSGLNVVVLGLTLSSSWGNGHATTWRALLRALVKQGADVTFLERDMPWYAANRDLPDPDFARLRFYESPDDLRARFVPTIREADAVIVGSYVPDGVQVIDWVIGEARGTVAFYDIDTPVTLAALARGEETYLARRQIPLFDTYLSFTGGPTLDLLRKRYGARQPRALYCTVDADRYRPNPDIRPRWRLGYLGTYSEDRQPTLSRLLLQPAQRSPEADFVVAGPRYPDTICWPPNVLRIEHLPPAEHPGFYSAQAFTLNVTRADMIAAGWSPSVRLFEAAACGTPIISDRWEGLEELFPLGEAILVADTTEDVLAHLDLSPSARRALGVRARDITLGRHRAEIRAAELETFLTTAKANTEEVP